MPDVIGRAIATIIAAALLTACLGVGVVAGACARLNQMEMSK